MVREFKILNEKGQSYSLMDIENYCLLTGPSGLGCSFQTEYEQIGYTFIESLRTIQQEPFNGTLNFLSYDNYKSFADFIANSETLKLAYKIPFKQNEKEYLKDIQLQNLSKTEKQPNGIISEPVVFNCLSLWYEENTVSYYIEPQSGEIRWDFEWDGVFTDYDSQSIEYKNNGHVEAPILLEIEGPAVNPKLEIYVDKKLYQTLDLTIEIDEYEKILYCSKEAESYIRKQNVDETTEDLLDLDVIDFENDNVVRLPRGYDCEIKLSADDTIQKAKLTILPQFFTV